jgi:AcrR family transcriptional regulator
MMERSTTAVPKRRLKGPERRAKIEHAAAELFAERGFEATSIEQIAEAAGVSRTVIYDHYPSKIELQIALAQQHSAALLAHMAERVGDDPSPLARLRSGIDAVLEFLQDDRYAWRVLFSEPPADPRLAELARELQRRATEAIAAMIGSDPATQEVIAQRGQESVMRLASFMRSGVSGLVAWWYENPEVPRERLVDEVVELLWFGMDRVIRGESASA